MSRPFSFTTDSTCPFSVLSSRSLVNKNIKWTSSVNTFRRSSPRNECRHGKALACVEELWCAVSSDVRHCIMGVKNLSRRSTTVERQQPLLQWGVSPELIASYLFYKWIGFLGFQCLVMSFFEICILMSNINQEHAISHPKKNFFFERWKVEGERNFYLATSALLLACSAISESSL